MKAIQGFDVSHQLWRLRHGRNLPDAEVELIMRTIVESVESYEQVVEVKNVFQPLCFLLSMLKYTLFT